MDSATSLRYAQNDDFSPRSPRFCVRYKDRSETHFFTRRTADFLFVTFVFFVV